MEVQIFLACVISFTMFFAVATKLGFIPTLILLIVAAFILGFGLSKIPNIETVAGYMFLLFFVPVVLSGLLANIIGSYVFRQKRDKSVRKGS